MILIRGIGALSCADLPSWIEDDGLSVSKGVYGTSSSSRSQWGLCRPCRKDTPYLDTSYSGDGLRRCEACRFCCDKLAPVLVCNMLLEWRFSGCSTLESITRENVPFDTIPTSNVLSLHKTQYKRSPALLFVTYSYSILLNFHTIVPSRPHSTKRWPHRPTQPTADCLTRQNFPNGMLPNNRVNTTASTVL